MEKPVTPSVDHAIASLWFVKDSVNAGKDGGHDVFHVRDSDDDIIIMQLSAGKTKYSYVRDRRSGME